MRRSAIIIALIVMTALAGGSTFVYSQGRKGQVQDPVCGLWVDKDSELSVTHKGVVYYFCSKKDAATFKENPEKYINKR